MPSNIHKYDGLQHEVCMYVCMSCSEGFRNKRLVLTRTGFVHHAHEYLHQSIDTIINNNSHVKCTYTLV